MNFKIGDRVTVVKYSTTTKEFWHQSGVVTHLGIPGLYKVLFDTEIRTRRDWW